MDTWIDTLARWSAGGISRRAALHRIGGTLAGAALIGLLPAQPAFADDPGLAICLEACGEIRNSKHRKQCQEACQKCQRNGHSGNCIQAVEGGSAVCAVKPRNAKVCDKLQSCTSSHECPETILCVVNTKCGPGGVCVPVCNA